MAQYNADGTRRDLKQADDRAAETSSPRVEDVPPVAQNAFSDVGSVTVAALLHLMRLMGAELVLLRGIDIKTFEQAMRAKIGDFSSPTPNREAREAGLAYARYLTEQVMTQIRAQAELKKSLAATNRSAAPASKETAIPLKLLN
jgi:hypothetical protein